ncbi:hypothetical protein GCM10010329_73830 [Streptomyces spiroverticillatus]|uniref:Uncharacterized protein n=1 Tax=Streptomyces finlayi TaxID=67296 RepID=A0A918X6H5_9ACTN|nr:hypothetical protein [Streptomyces finlayi]GHA39829.1 hypothetical protein GCM10010329_73830 [Streptomyces spiroverticillatus]GHD14599.1 hypothetical protein GCM10010334_73990 [Streptomyces finlayi]
MAVPNPSPAEAPFAPSTGDGPPPPEPPELRAAAVRTAFDGLLQIRRLTQGSASAPAAWELRQFTNAVALALEAAPLTPSATDADGHRTATGYRVRPGEEPQTVAVEWLGPSGSGAAAEEREQLTRCADVLTALGWDALLYRGPRRRWFAEVRPPHGSR